MEAENIVEEPQANPYNAKKDWATPIQSNTEDANGLFFEHSQATSDEAPEETEKPKQKRANYKKRYDDLKRHHDSKIAEFKQREQELLASTQSNKPVYQAPRSPEELEEFKEKYGVVVWCDYFGCRHNVQVKDTQRTTGTLIKQRGYQPLGKDAGVFEEE